MKRTGMANVEQAISFYRRLEDEPAKTILDFMIDHPGERFDGAALVRQLDLGEHRDVARATFHMGRIASELGLERPWTEGQLGYLMPEAEASLLRQARSTISSATST